MCTKSTPVTSKASRIDRVLRVALPFMVLAAAFLVYQANFGVSVVEEKQCKGNLDDFFIQISEYNWVLKLTGSSDGNMKITNFQGGQVYYPQVHFIGSGNQKKAFFSGELPIESYIFANQILRTPSFEFQCF